LGDSTFAASCRSRHRRGRFPADVATPNPKLPYVAQNLGLSGFSGPMGIICQLARQDRHLRNARDRGGCADRAGGALDRRRDESPAHIQIEADKLGCLSRSLPQEGRQVLSRGADLNAGASRSKNSKGGRARFRYREWSPGRNPGHQLAHPLDNSPAHTGERDRPSRGGKELQDSLLFMSRPLPARGAEDNLIEDRAASRAGGRRHALEVEDIIEETATPRTFGCRRKSASVLLRSGQFVTLLSPSMASIRAVLQHIIEPVRPPVLE